MNHLRCPYCGLKEFSHLDEVSSHLATVTAKGINICKALDISIDPHKAGDLFPMKILGRKYVPKDNNGNYVCLNNDGKIAKDIEGKPIKLVSNQLHAKNKLYIEDIP